MPGCVIDRIRPFWICLRRSMQKLGAVMGLVLFFPVRKHSGREAEADRVSLYWVLLFFMVRSSSSGSGCAIL